jgi:Fic family protein
MSYTVSALWELSVLEGTPRALRRPCRYEAYVPDQLSDVEVSLIEDVAGDVSDAERAIQRLNSGEPRLASLEAVARLLLRAEAVASSRIEGLEMGTRRLARAATERSAGGPPSDVTAEAILGNIEAMALAVEQLADRPTLTVDDVLATHRALMQRTRQAEYGGVVRDRQNWIGGNAYNPCGAAYVPPPHDRVLPLLEDLAAFLNSDRYPPLVHAALVHAQFETIHPFADGNGRTGRALIHLVLRRRGLAPRYVPPISLILATRSREYIGGLTAYRYEGDPRTPAAQAGINEWVMIFAAAAHQAVLDAERFAERLDTLVAGWRAMAAPLRARSAADVLIRALPAAPVVTVETAARLIGRSVQATNGAVGRLAAAGVLVPIRDVRRNRTFEAAGLLDLLTRFERSLASLDGDTQISSPVRRVPARPGPSSIRRRSQD